MEQNKNTIRSAANNFDTFINQGGVGAALFFVLLTLIAVNLHSLWFVMGYGEWVYLPIAILGSLGFSLITTVIIRKQVRPELKYLFPVFDAFLVFLGLNLGHWSELLADPLRFSVTIFFSLFTWAGLTALGLINFHEQKMNMQAEIDKLKEERDMLKSDLYKSESELEETKESLTKLKESYTEIEESYTKISNENTDLKSKIEANGQYNSDLQTKITSLKDTLNDKETQLKDTLSKYEGLQSDVQQYESEMQTLRAELDKYKNKYNQQAERIKELEGFESAYYQFEKGRILKKKESNRTAEEQETLQKAYEILK